MQGGGHDRDDWVGHGLLKGGNGYAATPMSADLTAVIAAVLALSDEKDSPHDNDLRDAALNPRLLNRLFPSCGAHLLMLDPAHWADLAAAFVANTAAAVSRK